LAQQLKLVIQSCFKPLVWFSIVAILNKHWNYASTTTAFDHYLAEALPKVNKRQLCGFRSMDFMFFTLSELEYNLFVLWNRPKTSSCRLPYQRPSSSADCARELFKPSKDSASLLVCTRKNFLDGGCGFFVSGIISEVVLGPFWLMLPGLGPNR